MPSCKRINNKILSFELKKVSFLIDIEQERDSHASWGNPSLFFYSVWFSVLTKTYSLASFGYFC